MSKDIFIFKSNGNYLGFIRKNSVFSRDGIYLGWADKIDKIKIVWDSEGKFRGILIKENANHYIITPKFEISPFSRTPKKVPNVPIPPDPPQNVLPITLPVEFEDAF